MEIKIWVVGEVLMDIGIAIWVLSSILAINLHELRNYIPDFERNQLWGFTSGSMLLGYGLIWLGNKLF